MVLSRTPDSFISPQRSLPSRLLSPTPVNTEYPPCSDAILRMSSRIRTVLPTPAPPKRPILPPLEKGTRRSITLIPVSRICAEGYWSVKEGAFLWISHLSSGSRGPALSIGLPRASKSLPVIFSPTGTLTDEPRDSATRPLIRPSVALKDTHLTTPDPLC